MQKNAPVQPSSKDVEVVVTEEKTGGEKKEDPQGSHSTKALDDMFNPDCAVESVARRRKPLRNVQLERFCDVGIFINMSRNKIGKSRQVETTSIFKPQLEAIAQSGLKKHGKFVLT